MMSLFEPEMLEKMAKLAEKLNRACDEIHEIKLILEGMRKLDS